MSLESWAERHDGLIVKRQARAEVGDRTVRRRLEEGIWRQDRRGVIVVNGTPPTWRQAVRGGLLACPGALASHVTTLELFDAPVPARLGHGIHVLTLLDRVVALDGIVHHRTGHLPECDVTERHGIPCTSPLRAVLDSSGSLTVRELGEIVDDLCRRRILRIEPLRERVVELRAAPGRSVRTLRAVLAGRLADFDPGESSLESRIARLIATGRIVRPAQQHKVSFGDARYRLDFAWPEQKVYLEGNGFGFHRYGSDLDRDARRQNLLVADGWRPIEITWRMTDREILATLRAFGLTADTV